MKPVTKDAKLTQKGCLLEGLCCAFIKTPGNFAIIIHSFQDCANVIPSGIFRNNLNRFYCTNLSEQDIISGQSAERLRECITLVAQRRRPEIIYVFASCVSEIIGEDISRIVEEASVGLEMPVVAVDSSGFSEVTQSGVLDKHSMLLCEVCRGDGTEKIPRSVNIIGYEKDDGEIGDILGRAGIEINIWLDSRSGLDAWKKLPAGQINIVPQKAIFSSLLVEMWNEYKIPHIELPAPVGLDATEKFILKIAEYFDAADCISGFVYDARKKAEELTAGAVSKLKGLSLGFNIGTVKDYEPHNNAYSGLSYLWFFKELNMDISLLVQGDPGDERRKNISNYLKGMKLALPFHIFADTRSLAPVLSEFKFDLVYISDSLKDQAVKAGVPMIFINRLKSGFSGYIRNVESIEKSLSGKYEHGNFSEDIHECRPNIGKTIQDCGGVEILSSKMDMTDRLKRYTIPAISHTPFFGEFTAFHAIPDAIVVMHLGAGCKAKGQQHLVNHDWMKESHSQVFWTEITGIDIITDASKKLEESIVSAWERHRPGMIGVIVSSIIEITGFDVKDALRPVRDKIGCPVVYAPSSGFSGDLFQGYSDVAMEILQLVDWSVKPQPEAVNLLGYFFDRYELDQIANLHELIRMLSSVGLKINSVLFSGQKTPDLMKSGRGAVNAVFPYLKENIQKLDSISGRKSVSVDLPVGIEGSSQWLREIGRVAGVDENKIEKFISQEKRKILPLLDIARRALTGREAVIIQDTPLAAVIAVFANSLGMRIKTVCLTDRTLGGRDALLDAVARLSPNAQNDFEILVNPDNDDINALVSTQHGKSRSARDIFIMSNIESCGDIENISKVEIGFPSNTKHFINSIPYMGFNGAAALAQRFMDAANNCH